MATNAQARIIAPQGDQRVDQWAGAMLDGLDAGVLVLDPAGAIGYRNRIASLWTAGHDRIDLAFPPARLVDPFDGWAVELSHMATEGTNRKVRATLECPRGSTPSVVTLRCSPLSERMAHAKPGFIVLMTTEGDAVDANDTPRHSPALGKLVARVAHELNNPLDGILRYINLAIRISAHASEPKLKQYLSESRSGLMRMAHIIGELLAFSRATNGRFDESDVNEVIEQTIRDCAGGADAKGVIITADFQSAEMPPVRGNRIHQICLNLIRNAIDAMPEGGRLMITSGLIDGEVVIRVADTGVGLPAESDRVFEPFFTTKGPGQGTGLGLAICKEFVEALRGSITAAPGVDGGTVMTVRIPANAFQPVAPPDRPWKHQG